MGEKRAELYFGDDLFRFQTYISDAYEIGHHEINTRSAVQNHMPDVWDEFRGRGVEVGILGVVDRKHPDLRKNYKKSHLDHHDPLDEIGGSSPYGTFAAGIVTADDDGRGLVGMAPDAKVFSWTGDPRERPDILVMQGQQTPYGGPDDAGLLVDTKARDGLGRITVANSPADGRSTFSAQGSIAGETISGVVDSEYTIHSDRHVITTVGLGMHGFQAHIPGGPVNGDMLLVGAPVGTSSYLQLGGYDGDPGDPAYDPPLNPPGGVFDARAYDDVASTLGLDHSGERGNNDSLGLWEVVAEAKLLDEPIKARDYGVDFFGTGASAVVGGAVAPMLDANPDLGWRDVQAILAYSANPFDMGDTPYFDESIDWTVYGEVGHHWNGGALIHSGEYGFGSLDTHAAVRLAETWGEPGEGPRTSGNEVVATAQPIGGEERSVGPLNGNSGVRDGFVDHPDGATIRFRAPRDMEIEHVALEMAYEGATGNGSDFRKEGNWADEVGLHLIAPSGQRSHVAGIADGGIYADAIEGDSIDHTFTTRAFWGQGLERGDVWELRIEAGFRDEIQLDVTDLALKFYGAPADRDDVYVYTDALVLMKVTDAHESHGDGSVADASGHGGLLRDGRGRDVLNASAMTYDLELHAGPGGRGTAADGEDVGLYRLARGTAMDALIAGDGADRLVGWRGADRLEGGRGRDRLEGRGAQTGWRAARGVTGSWAARARTAWTAGRARTASQAGPDATGSGRRRRGWRAGAARTGWWAARARTGFEATAGATG